MARRSRGGGGHIIVHDAEACVELLGLGAARAEEKEERSGSPQRLSSPERRLRSSPRPLPPSSPPRPLTRSSSGHTLRMEDWLSRKARRAIVALPDDPELAAVKEVCREIREEAGNFISDLDAYLSVQENQEHCKKEMLYRKWTERVFLPVQSRLTTAMDSDTVTSVGANRRNLFNQYLDYRNRKAVFLDTVSPDEYDPLSLPQSGMKVSTGPLDDPLLSQAVNRAAEQAVERGPASPPPLGPASPPPLGREDTDCTVWLAMQLVDINSDARARSQLKVKGHQNKSALDRVGHVGEEEGGGCEGEELRLPHKTPISYPRRPLTLDWPEPRTVP